jgi:hypothetical protein
MEFQECEVENAVGTGRWVGVQISHNDRENPSLILVNAKMLSENFGEWLDIFISSSLMSLQAALATVESSYFNCR